LCFARSVPIRLCFPNFPDLLDRKEPYSASYTLSLHDALPIFRRNNLVSRIWRIAGGSQRTRAAYTSDGTPKINLGINHWGLRMDRQTLPATRADSTATSQAELPAPITSTFLPRQSSVTPLKSWECMNWPENSPGYWGYLGSQ